MLFYRKNKISVYTESNDIYPSTYINIGFDIKCNWFVLQKLKRAHPCDCAQLAYASETTCVAYTVYLTIVEKLKGSVLDLHRSKLLSIDCNYHNGQFIISIQLPNSLPLVKKNILNIISKLDVSKGYSLYSECMRILNGKPNKKEFLYCVNFLIGTPVVIFICGNILFTKDTLETFSNNISDKLILKTNNTKPNDKPLSLSKTRGVSDFPTIKFNSYYGVFVRDFIIQNTKLPVNIYSNNIIVYNKKWDSISNKFKTLHVQNLIEKKYKKLGKDFIPLIVYNTMANVNLDINTLIKLYKAPPSFELIQNNIVKVLGI